MATNKLFGRVDADGNISVFGESGERATRIKTGPIVWPVGSDLSARYEHPEGIVLTPHDAAKIGLAIESAPKMSFADVAHYIAQGAINIDCGITTIDKGSRVYRAMARLCEMLSNGEITQADLDAHRYFFARCSDGRQGNEQPQRS